jgi:integrase/recombinase XerD
MHVTAPVWLVETVRVDVGCGMAYWSVLAGPTLAPVVPVDHFLRHLRFARNAAESTTKSYAGHLKRFERWRVGADLSWEAAAREIARYLLYLRTTPRIRPGRGVGQLPTGGALVPALAAIHGFYRHAVDVGAIDAIVLPLLFEVAEQRFTGERGRMGLRPRLRVDARPTAPALLEPSAATTEEFAAMLACAGTARDACLIGMLGGLGLRVGQVASLWREDVHLMPAGRQVPGCGYMHGPHVHVVRRDGHPRGAISKARSANVLPVPGPVEMLYAAWLWERQRIPDADVSPWAFVSFPGPAGNVPGEPLSTRRIYDIVTGAAATAGLRHIHPHMLRHGFGSVAADLDVSRDVLQRLLGHRTLTAQDVYRQVSTDRVIEAAALISRRLSPGGTGPMR